eukprot:m.239656 g.239656  ORF g.239656 m.239656 type:complete len:82 (+) comp26263_c0_seq4:3340-3585(+)
MCWLDKPKKQTCQRGDQSHRQRIAYVVDTRHPLPSLTHMISPSASALHQHCTVRDALLQTLPHDHQSVPTNRAVQLKTPAL